MPLKNTAITSLEAINIHERYRDQSQVIFFENRCKTLNYLSFGESSKRSLHSKNGNINTSYIAKSDNVRHIYPSNEHSHVKASKTCVIL